MNDIGDLFFKRKFTVKYYSQVSDWYDVCTQGDVSVQFL